MTVSPTNLTIQEGSTGTYTVVLNSQPTATVTISVTASDDSGKCHDASGASCTRKSGVATVDKSNLTFTTTDWNTAQTVTVTATDEDMAGVFKHAKVEHEASGGGYDSLVVAQVLVTVTDDDVTNIVYEIGSPDDLQKNSAFGTYEGSAHSYYVSLTSEPTAATTVALASEDISRVTVSPDTLTFSTTNWNVAQSVSFSVADNDALGEGRVQVRVTSTISGTGSNFDGQSVRPFTVNVYNNDIDPGTVNEGDSFVRTFGWEEYPAAYLIRAESVGGAAAIAPASVQVTEDNYESVPFTVTGVSAGQGKINFWIGNYLWRSFLVTVNRSASPVPTVTLSASPNPVREGSSVTVTARLSSALSSSVTIPITLTAGTAEPDDYGSLSGITISAGSTTGTGTIPTTADPDTASETFTVALASPSSQLQTGTPSSVEVTILDTTPLNLPPTVTASCDPCVVRPGGEVRLTAEATDPENDRLTYEWSAQAGRFTDGSGELEARWRAPNEVGVVDIRVYVVDTYGAEASASVTVEVVNSAPVFKTPFDPFVLRENEDGRVRPVAVGAVVVEDPDGDEVTCLLASGDETRFVVSARDGSVWYVGPGEDYETKPNLYRLMVLARDAHGAEATVEVIVEVANVNEAPEPAADSATTNEEVPVTVEVLANDADPDGDALRVESVSQPGHGTARIAADGAVVYEPEPDWNGTDRFVYTVADGNGGTAEAEIEVRVEPVPDAPVAMADRAATDEDEPVMVDVLANDRDVDGDELRIEWVSQPAYGTARIAEDGGILYLPEADWHGMDRFAYEVADGTDRTAEAEVEVRVEPVNDAPVAVADVVATREDQPVTVGVLANDWDVDGDALRIESVSRPAHGTAQIAGDGGILYAPEPDWHGTDRFAYTVADGNGGAAEAEAEVRVEPVNDVPVALADTVVTAEDQPVTVDVLANDRDVDGDALRIEWVTQPAHGTARIAGTAVVYAPEADWHGTDRFAYTVADSSGRTADAEVEVRVESVNDGPVAVGRIPDLTLEEGGAAAVFDLEPFFDDADGDSLTYTAASSATTVATVTVAGSVLTVTPVGYGATSIEVTARDPGGLSATHAFALSADDEGVRMVLDETLAAMARAHVASARMTLGRHVAASQGGGVDCDTSR